MIFGFELKLLAELGLQPDLGRTRMAASTSAILETLSQADWRTISGLRLDFAQKNDLRQFLHGFLIYHLGRIPKGRDGTLEVRA